jgi:hypothetical protein
LWVRSAGEEERGHVDVQWAAGLQMAVVFDVDGVAEQCPAVAVVVFDVVAGVEQISQAWQVFELDGLVGWRDRHGLLARSGVGRGGERPALVGDVVTQGGVGHAAHAVFADEYVVDALDAQPGCIVAAVTVFQDFVDGVLERIEP